MNHPRRYPAHAPHEPMTPSLGTGRKSGKGFAIGWLSITVATAVVFAAFAGPLIENGQAAALSQRLSATPTLERVL